MLTFPFRKPYAKRIGTSVGDLDERVAVIVRTWLEAMAQPPKANAGRDES
jgi:hypothetical protein